MNNIFEGAKFGDLYKTRAGKKAIYLKKTKCDTGREETSPAHEFCTEECTFMVNEEGLMSWEIDDVFSFSEVHPDCDIVAKWEEPINVNMLDKLAHDSLGENLDEMYEGYSPEDIYEHGFKAGYIKAKSEL